MLGINEKVSSWMDEYKMKTLTVGLEKYKKKEKVLNHFTEIT